MSTTTINTFTFPITDASIRTLKDEKGEPWFVAGDVCDALGLKPAPSNGSYQNHYRRFAIDELGLAVIPQPNGNNIRMKIISESGLYKLIIRSTKPEALQFQDWVTRDVLPSIRKNGGYIMGQEKVVTGEMSDLEFLAKAQTVAVRVLEQMTAERDALLAENQKLAPKAQKYSEFMDTDGLINLTGVAKVLDMTAIALGRKLREIGWLNKRTESGVMPNDPIVKKGYMRTRIIPVSSYKTVVQGRFTPVGVDALLSLFGKAA